MDHLIGLRRHGAGGQSAGQVVRGFRDLALTGGDKGGLDLRAHRRDILADEEQVAYLLVEELDGARLAQGRLAGGFDLGGQRRDDLLGVARDRRQEVDVDPVGADAVRMEPDVVGASPELLDADGANGHSVELPAKEPDLSASEHPLRALHVLDRGLDGEDRGHPEVGEESEERLGPGGRLVAFHAEVLERGQRIDHDPAVGLALDLGAQHLFEGGDRHLDARELGGLADREVDPVERDRRTDGGDVLERSALEAHHVGDRVEDLHLPELGQEGPVVPEDLVRGLLHRYEEGPLPVPDSVAQELERQRGLPRPRRSDHQIGPTRHQPAVQHSVELGSPGR